MKTNPLLTAALCGACFLTGCVYDDGHSVGQVSVSAGTSPDYYGEYDAYTPYYSDGPRRYYRADNRYVYYDNRRPYYVTTLPGRAVYVTPNRQVVHSRPVVHSRSVARRSYYHD